MRELNMNEIEAISGGDYEVSVGASIGLSGLAVGAAAAGMIVAAPVAAAAAIACAGIAIYEAAQE